MTVAALLAYLRRARRARSPRVRIDIDVFTPTGRRAVRIDHG